MSPLLAIDHTRKAAMTREKIVNLSLSWSPDNSNTLSSGNVVRMHSGFMDIIQKTAVLWNTNSPLFHIYLLRLSKRYLWAMGYVAFQRSKEQN